MKAPRQRYGKHDEVTIRGIRYRWRGRVRQGHAFERLDQPGLLETFTDQRIAGEVSRPDYARRVDHLLPGKVRARASSGLGSIRDLPEDERADVAFRQDLVERFLVLAERGEAVRTYASVDVALLAIAADLEAERRDRLAAPDHGRKPRVDSVRAAEAEEPRPREDLPCAKVLLDWVRRYERGGRDPRSLRDGRHSSGNKSERHGAEIRRLTSDCADGYLAMERPTYVQCHEDLRIAVMNLNERRAAEGLKAVRCPSIKFICAEVDRRRAAQVHIARHGADKADGVFSPLGEGVDARFVGQRVEMDEWKVQVQAVLERYGVWQRMDDDLRMTAARIRLWACTALDAATRATLGLSVSRSGNTIENALACLAMVVTDKTRVAEWAGAETPWTMACVPDEIVTDGGPAFRSEEFRSAVKDLGSRPMNPPKGKPNARGRQERYYRTIETRLSGRLPGRTFSNPVDRGDYDSGDRAALVETLVRKVLILFVADVYHCSQHDGLGGEMPIDAFERLVAEYDLNGDPGLHVRREALGVELRRDLDQHGVRAFNLFWTSDALQELFRKLGGHKVVLRLDPMNLGWVSVRIDDHWETCGCRRENMEGVPLIAWLEMEADRARRHKGKAKLRETGVLKGIERIKAMVEEGMNQFGLGGARPTTRELDLIEERMLHGFVSPERRGIDAPTLAEALGGAWIVGMSGDGSARLDAILGRATQAPDGAKTSVDRGPPGDARRPDEDGPETEDEDDQDQDQDDRDREGEDGDDYVEFEDDE